MGEQSHYPSRMSLSSFLARWRRSPTGLRDVVATALDGRMMERALGLAAQGAALGEVPVGAVVYRLEDGTVLGEAHNRREVDRDPSAHAEFLAIQSASRALGDWRLTGCGLAVTLEPCPMCAGLIVNARVARVVYGAADPKAGAVQTLYALLSDPRLNHRPDVVGGVERERAAEMLREFFRGLRGRDRGRGPGG